MHPRSRRVSLATVVVLALVGALSFATASSAGATPPDLSTREAIEAYLVSIGVNPAEAVWQETSRNYAGPRCPGSSWNCVPATAPIVQITDAGGTNLFDCSGPDCVVVQVAHHGGHNGAACLKSDRGSDVVQVCDITQSNDGDEHDANAAGIAQTIQQRSGSTQMARQVARITQQNSLGTNVAGTLQIVGQSQVAKSGTVITQIQEAHQAATVDQLTTEGDNISLINQRQNQSQKVTKASTAVTQIQNNDPSGTNQDFVCDQPGDAAFDQDKNQCGEVVQNSNVLPPTGGSLDSSLLQVINETQSASRSPLGNQTQGEGTFLSGQQGTVDQLSSGVATSEADQDMTQTVNASNISTLTQTQHTGDPRCCQSQGTNPADTADIDQSTNQSASSAAAEQDAAFTGSCITTGSCHVLQSSTIDGSTDTAECTGPSCFVFNVCAESEGGNACTPYD